MGFQLLDVIVQSCCTENSFYRRLTAITGFDVLWPDNLHTPVRVVRVLEAVAVIALSKRLTVVKIQSDPSDATLVI